jgi:hypothetical protein
MDGFAKELAKQIKKEYPTEEDRLRVTNKIMGQLINTTHIQKIHAGGLPELEASAHIGLQWISTEAHGADAFNKEGQRVELKCTGVRKATNKVPGKTNANYDFPKNVDAYTHYATSTQYAGGHYFVVMNYAKTRVRWWVHITQQQLANSVREFIKDHPKSKKANFGSTLCKTCKGWACARWDHMRGLAHTCIVIVQ